MAWQSIRGHDAIVRKFRVAFERGRLGHAYLFVGPSGVGKRTFARELAKALYCEYPPDPLTACDRCASCKLLSAGTHPDFTTLRKSEDKQELPVDAMHEFVAAMGLKASRGGRKIGFVEDADDFNEESANAFLKALEEPPPGSLLILRATTLESQLPTILSRCQPVRFMPLPEEDVRAVLAEQGIADGSARDRLVRLSRGCPGRAIALGDASLWEFRESLLAAFEAAKLNHAALAERWTRYVEDAGKDSGKQRARASLALQVLVELVDSTLKLSLGSYGGEESVRLQPLARQLEPDQLLAMLDAILDADRQVDQRVNVPLVLELLVDRLAAA